MLLKEADTKRLKIKIFEYNYLNKNINKNKCHKNKVLKINTKLSLIILIQQ